MICEIALQKRRCPNNEELITAIKRNFGGLESLDSVKEFGKHLPSILAHCVSVIFLHPFFCLSKSNIKRLTKYIIIS